MKSVLILMTLLGAGASAAELKVIPYPRSVKAGAGKLVLAAPVKIAVSANAEDRFAAGLLAEEIKNVARREAAIGAPAGTAPAIVIGRAGEAAIDAEIVKRKLDRAALQDPEGYLLDVSPAGALVAARTAAGVFYGVQTLRQLVRAEGARAVGLPVVSIADWPALRVRGLMIDTSQGAVLSPEALKSAVRTCAEYKINLVNLYIEHLFPYTHSPLTAEGAALGFEEMKALVAYARRYHVDIVPQQESFGHLHSLLKWELYSHMAETTRGDVLAVADDRAVEWVSQAAKELAAVFPSKYLHIGADETFELGLGRSRDMVAKLGMGKTYTAFLQKVADRLRPLNRKMVFWGDIVKKNPEGIAGLPKDMIVATWGYKAQDDFAAYIKPFRDAGMEVWVCPGVGNWRRIFPNFTEAAANIDNFVAEGKRLGATGVLNTHWNDHGEEFFNLSWYGVVFGAAASWQPGRVDGASFDSAFDWAFYRNDSDLFMKVIRRLEGVNELLRKSGFPEADNSLAWIQPFSKSGAAATGKLLPLAGDIRRRAEESMIDLQFHAGRARLHADTVPFLRFAARRLDTLGLKAQLSRDIGDLYRGAMENTEVRAHNLREITGRSGVGRVQDVLDAVSELKAMLRALWPAENRAYYLDSLMVRYDAELLYWHEKKRQFTEIRTSGNPPAPESVGLVLP